MVQNASAGDGGVWHASGEGNLIDQCYQMALCMLEAIHRQSTMHAKVNKAGFVLSSSSADARPRHIH